MTFLLPDDFRILSVAHDFDCVGCQVLVAGCIEDLQDHDRTYTQVILEYPEFSGIVHSASVFREPVKGISREDAERDQPA